MKLELNKKWARFGTSVNVWEDIAKSQQTVAQKWLSFCISCKSSTLFTGSH